MRFEDTDELKGAELTCLWTLFDEEWQHNWFANRDLDVLERR